METLGDAVYDSEWWLTGGTHMRHAALMIIQRSQGTKSLQAIGIVDLDVQTYVAVWGLIYKKTKICFKFCYFRSCVCPFLFMF